MKAIGSLGERLDLLQREMAGPPSRSRSASSPSPAAPRPSPAPDEHAAAGDPEAEMEEAAQRLLE
eukprot:4019978-Alexandrium_andersonii.AAC.1